MNDLSELINERKQMLDKYSDALKNFREINKSKEKFNEIKNNSSQEQIQLNGSTERIDSHKKSVDLNLSSEEALQILKEMNENIERVLKELNNLREVKQEILDPGDKSDIAILLISIAIMVAIIALFIIVFNLIPFLFY